MGNEIFEEIKKKYKKSNKYMLCVSYEDIGILIQIIEKQSKEIEELKNGQIDFWISDKEIEERIRNKFVSKDKIKAILEEYKYTEIGDSEKIIEFYKKMQSLLEKE